MPVIVEFGDTEIEFPEGMSEEEMHRALAQQGQPAASEEVGFGGLQLPELTSERLPAPSLLADRPAAIIPAAGKLLRAGIQDPLNIFTERFLSPLGLPPSERVYSPEEQAQVRDTGVVEMEPRPLAEEFPNIAATLSGEPLPVKENIQDLPLPGRLLAGAAGGLVETAPQLAGVVAGQALGIPAPLSAGALFGITEEGGYDPVAGGIAAALPFVGRFSGEIAGSLAQKLGVSAAEALNIVKGASGLLVPVAGLAAKGELEISKLPPEQQDAARVELYASLLGQAALGPVGVRYEKNYATPKRPIQESRVIERAQADEGRTQPKTISSDSPQRSGAVEEAPKIEGLTKEEQAAFQKEVADLDVPVVMTEEGPVEAPFAGRKLGPGVIAAADRANGQIVVNAPELQAWLREDVPPAQREQAVRSLLNEERLHLSTSDEAALEYLGSLTGPERAIAERIYRGENQAPLSPTELGHEALRYRMQQLARMTPREIAEAARKERWTVQGLSVLSGVLRNFREVMGTKASRTGEAIADHILSNLETAQGVVGAPQFAMRKTDVPVQDKLEELKAMPIEDFFREVNANERGLTGAAWELGRSAETVEDVTAMVAARKEASSKVKEAMAQGDFDTAQRYAMQGQFYREAYEAATGTGSAGFHFRKNEPGYKPPVPMEEGAIPQARRKKPTGQPEFFLPPVERAEKLERPGVEAAPEVQPKLALTPAAKGVERESPFETITPAKVSAAAEAHLSKPVPSFKQFVAEAQGEFGTVQRGQLRDVWEDAVWKKVMSASGKELERLRSELKLVKNFGEREVADVRERPATPAQADLSREAKARVREGERIEKSRQNYRTTVARGIATKLVKQGYEAETLKKAIGRSELTPDDLAESRPNFYREISPDEAASPTALKNLMTEFRASSALSTRITRRMIALVDKQTGEVHHVSAYLDPEAGLRIVDPRSSTRARPNVPIETLLKRYRPISTSLLDEPVKNFHQRYESVGQFNEQFANDARNRMESQRSYDATLGEEALVVSGEEPTGPLREQPLMDAEVGALLDHFNDANEGIPIESVENVRIAMKDVADLTDLGEKPQAVFSAYLKLYDRIRSANPDLTEGQAIEKMATEIYENTKTSKTREDFIRRTMGSREAKAGQAVQGSEGKASPTSRELRALDRPPIETYPVPVIGRGEPNPFPFERGPGPVTLARGKGITGQRVLPPETPKRAVKRTLLPEGRGLLERPVKAPAQAGPLAIRPQVPSAAEGTTRPLPQARRKGKANAGQYALESMKEVAEAPHRYYSQWLSPVIRAKGGEAGARAADVSDKVIDRQKALYGTLTPTLDPARELAGGSTRVPVIGQVPNPRQIAANTWLDKLSNPVSKFTGIRNVVGAMEGTAPMPANVRPVIAAAKRADAAAMAVLAPVVRMQASGKFQRNLSAFGYDMIAEGESHPQWRRWTGDTALLNQPHLNQIRAQYNQNAIRQNAHNAARGFATPPIQPLPMLSKADAVRQFRAFVKEWGDTLKDPTADPNYIEKINQDYQRLYPRAITDVRTPLGWQEVIHAHLPNYLEAVAQRASWTRAFREQYPDNTAGRDAFAALNSDVRSALPPNIVPYLGSAGEGDAGKAIRFLRERRPAPTGHVARGRHQRL